MLSPTSGGIRPHFKPSVHTLIVFSSCLEHGQPVYGPDRAALPVGGPPPGPAQGHTLIVFSSCLEHGQPAYGADRAALPVGGPPPGPAQGHTHALQDQHSLHTLLPLLHSIREILPILLRGVCAILYFLKITQKK